MLRVLAFSLSVLLLAACGQKGDLYLPNQAAHPDAPVAQPDHHAG